MTLPNVERGKLVKRRINNSVSISISKKEETHITRHEWASSIYTVYDPSEDGTYLSVRESKDAWYFDSVAKHISTCKNSLS